MEHPQPQGHVTVHHYRTVEDDSQHLHLIIQGSAIDEFRALLFKSLNTWEPSQTPRWILDISDMLDGQHDITHQHKNPRVAPAPEALQADPPAAPLSEEDLEAAYWNFDARKKGDGIFKGRIQSERDAFKWALRGLPVKDPRN